MKEIIIETVEKATHFYTDSSLADIVYGKMEDSILNLYVRWLDEKEFEDFADYAASMKRVLTETMPTATFLKATSRPFGFQFSTPAGYAWKISTTSKKYTLAPVTPIKIAKNLP